MNIASHFAAVACVCASLSCSAPPPGAPLDVSAIAGDWHASGIDLSISPSGMLSYESTRGVRTKLNGVSVSDLTTTGFNAGAFGLNTHFVINALPHDVEGTRRMTIDGNELSEVRGAAPPPAAPTDTLPLSAETALPPVGTLDSLVGVWDGGGMHLEIGADGSFSYVRSGLANRHVQGARIDNITATSFDMKVLALSSTFVVNAPPAVIDGEVRMTVDGVVVTKQR